MWALAAGGRGSDVSDMARIDYDSWKVHGRLFVELTWQAVERRAWERSIRVTVVIA